MPSIRPTESLAASKGQEELRLSSRIRRCVYDGVAVYEKQYTTDDWGGTEDIIRKRSEREFRLLDQLHSSHRFGRRLGLVRVVRYDPQSVTISTREVVGTPLGNWLRKAAKNRRSLLPWYLAGAWLRSFQSLPVPAGTSHPLSEFDPADLVEYCDLRLRSLRQLGYAWPDRITHGRLLERIEGLECQRQDWEKRAVLVHADYAPGNLIWGNGVLTPIDFAMTRLGGPLDDATYLIHRLEMYRVYRPWVPLPVKAYQRAILHGLGRSDADGSASYRLLMLRHLICRLHTYVRRRPSRLRQRVHDHWVRLTIRHRLQNLAEKGG